MNNQHQHNMDTCFQLPPWISVLLFRHFLVVFTPQFLQLRSGRVQCCETEKQVQLLTSDLKIKPQMTSVFDMDLTWLKRFDPVLSLTEPDRQRNVWFMFLPVETARQRRDQNRKWLKPLLRNYEAAEWISGNPQLTSCKHLIWRQNMVAFYWYYFSRM